MNVKKYCEQLAKYREHGVQFGPYMGPRWFIFKIVIAGIAFFMLIQQEETIRSVGILLSGYLVGAVGSNVRGFIAAREKWKMQRELTDWNKVDEHLRGAE